MGCRKNKRPDFLAADFLPADFNAVYTVEPFVIDFVPYLFDLLPFYFKSQDSYKDSNGKGLLERYLSIFGAHIAEEIIPEIRCYLDILDSSICDSRFLIPLSKSLGSPPDIFQSEAEYRNLLTYIVSVYKIKGTKESYELFFSILGFNVDINEIMPVSVSTIEELGTRYDSDNHPTYDGDNPNFTYDMGICQPCSQYDLELTPKPGTFLIINDSLKKRINQTISFNEPINAKLRNLIIND